MTEAATIRTVEHGEPSDLPETNWLWRRLYIFACTAAAFGLAYWVTNKVADIGTLRMIARYAIGSAVFFALIYIVGSGSEAITRLMAVLRSTRKETVTTAPPPAVLTTDPSGGTKVETPADDGELPANQRVTLP